MRCREPSCRCNRGDFERPRVRTRRNGGPAPALLTRIISRTETAQETLQQTLPPRGPHHQEPLDLLQPQACFARPLVELDPRRALIQQIGSRHEQLGSRFLRRCYDLFGDLDQRGIALRLAHPVKRPVGVVSELVLCQRARLVIAGAYWNDDQDDRPSLGAFEQRGQLL
jgi:hypothetical protein